MITMKKLLNKFLNIINPKKRRRANFSFSEIFLRFQNIIDLNNKILELMAEMGDKLSGDYIFDRHYITSSCQQISDLVYKLIYNLDALAPKKYIGLYDAFRKINREIEIELSDKPAIPTSDYTIPYSIINCDFSDIVGRKNANLAEIKNFIDIPVPEGFAITTKAFDAFMEYNRLWDKIETTLKVWESGEISSEEAASNIQPLIRNASIPPDLKRELIKALNNLEKITGVSKPFLAIRSSAWAEDSEQSFAGQYLTLLNEPSENVFHAYKEVVASAFSPNALEYMSHTGFTGREILMAVACQVMINAKVSGVLYTLDPVSPEKEQMIVTATWGLGAPLVSGEVVADQFKVARDPPYNIIALNIVRKERSLVPRAKGGIEIVPVPEELQTKACLKSEELEMLIEKGIIIERYFKKPQDIEYAFDGDGNMFILQARALNIKNQLVPICKDIPKVLKDHPVIFSNRGVIAQKGIATGKVYIVESDEQLDKFPHGAILVTRYTSPKLAKVIRKANAIITDIGSPTGHLGTIVREFRVPAIFNTMIATQVIKPGQEITVDAEENVVYEGKVKELCYYEFTEETFEETYEYRLLRRVLKKITPLNLIDPHDKNFEPSACKTFHDITRFVHEKAVEEIIESNYYANHSDNGAKRLDLNIPLDLVVIDIGNGIKQDVEDSQSKIKPEQISSIPMRSFIKGLTTPGAWSTEPMSVDFKSFMSSLTRTFASSVATPRYIGQNLAVISKEYANISLRLGYHFNMIDSYMSTNQNDNYIYFRFLGGATEHERRFRRAKFIAQILRQNDFLVDLRGDLVVARIKKMALSILKRKMFILGLLVAYTRQLDVRMVSELYIDKSCEEFNNILKNLNKDYREGKLL